MRRQSSKTVIVERSCHLRLEGLELRRGNFEIAQHGAQRPMLGADTLHRFDTGTQRCDFDRREFPVRNRDRNRFEFAARVLSHRFACPNKLFRLELKAGRERGDNSAIVRRQFRASDPTDASLQRREGAYYHKQHTVEERAT